MINMDKITINTYNQMAEEYDMETTDFWQKFPRSFLDKFIETVGINGRVLDIGSGPGRDGLLLKEAGLTVTCLDASEAMIKLSSEKGLDSVLGDFMNLPFANQSFSGAWVYTSLLHVPKKDINIALNEIKRILEPNGVLGLGMIKGDNETYRESSGVSLPRWFSFYNQEEIEKILLAHDFEIIHFEIFKPGSRNYLNFIAKSK
jgi:ubiquinone/menaquinone biosynthesis C-methylase UbiE